MSLANLWESITSRPGENVGRRPWSIHPLNTVIGYDENGNMQMVLISPFLPQLPKSSDQIMIRSNNRTDGKFAICFSLLDNSLNQQFICVCYDLLEQTASSDTENEGIAKAIDCFRHWQNLFATSKAQTLTEPIVRGLIGELYVLNNMFLPTYKPEEAINAWRGPYQEDRDFEFANNWYEVKAIGRSRQTCTISSLDQLDSDKDGELIICRLDKTSKLVNGSVSLNSLVNNIATKITEESHVYESFLNRLSFIGYNPDCDLAKESFIVSQVERYEVNHTFPRLRRSILSPSFADGKYDLTISTLTPWLK